MARASWEWVAAEGTAAVIGPDDPAPGGFAYPSAGADFGNGTHRADSFLARPV